MPKTVAEIPGLKELLDDTEAKAEKLIGKKVIIYYRLKIQHLSTDELAGIICDVCETKWEEIVSDTRKARVVLARHLYCYFAITVQKKTLKDIARIIHHKDHSSIIHARDKVQAMLDTRDELYMPTFEEVEKKVNEILFVA